MHRVKIILYFFVVNLRIIMIAGTSWPDIRPFLISGIRPDNRQDKSGIRADTGYKKAGLSGRISGASLLRLMYHGADALNESVLYLFTGLKG
jgi:hypothetical protein